MTDLACHVLIVPYVGANVKYKQKRLLLFAPDEQLNGGANRRSLLPQRRSKLHFLRKRKTFHAQEKLIKSA